MPALDSSPEQQACLQDWLQGFSRRPPSSSYFMCLKHSPSLTPPPPNSSALFLLLRLLWVCNSCSRRVLCLKVSSVCGVCCSAVAVLKFLRILNLGLCFHFALEHTLFLSLYCKAVSDVTFPVNSRVPCRMPSFWPWNLITVCNSFLKLCSSCFVL